MTEGKLVLRIEAFDMVDAAKSAPSLPQCLWWHVSMM